MAIEGSDIITSCGIFGGRHRNGSWCHRPGRCEKEWLRPKLVKPLGKIPEKRVC